MVKKGAKAAGKADKADKADKAPVAPSAKALVANCIKERGNWSQLLLAHKFDNRGFDPAKFREDMPVAGPKLAALVSKIRELDAADLRKHGHLFKHFIYSDVKSGYGAKLIASALAASGFTHGYSVVGSGFKLAALPARGAPDTFATLTSVSFFERPIGIRFRRELLRRFNTRPDNVHGRDLRIIILDSGFREGVDLFDVKYAHLFEPIATANDQKQAIGRVTRFCGQKGLRFHPTEGWPVEVYRYETLLTRDMRSRILSADPYLLKHDQKAFFDLFLKFSNIDPRKITFANELEAAAVDAAADKPLTAAIHGFGKVGAKASAGGAVGGGTAGAVPPPPPRAGHAELDAFVRKHYGAFAWPPTKMQNGCESVPVNLEFSPTQDFVRHFLTPASPYHGLLAFHSVGTGKTCTAIATATSSFEPAGWTIIYVTKHTLKADVWKNMFDQSCSVILQARMKEGLVIPKEHADRMRLISKSWKTIQPLSYRQFSNMLGGRSALAADLRAVNGAADPLKRTFIVIDEAHKLFAADVVGSEKGDVDVIRRAIHHSYSTSGASACKLLLMTGTPYTDDPMDMVRLLNLLRPAGRQLPETFDDFGAAYLDPYGKFTTAGRARFMDDLAGSISYLNRERDMRTFAYAVIKEVRVKMSEYEFEAELDEVLINNKKIDLATDRLKEYESSQKMLIEQAKATHAATLKNKEEAVKGCAGTAASAKACKDAAAAAKKEETENADNLAESLIADCAGNKKEVAACKRAIKAQLKAHKDEIKARHAAAVEECKKSAGNCAELKKELAALKKHAKADLDKAVKAAKDSYAGMIAGLKSSIAVYKRAGPGLNAALRKGIDADRSQQGALENCLKGRVPPAVRALKKGELADDRDLGSRTEASASRPDQLPVFLISGHGGEVNVPFDERPVLPPNTTLVVFSTCFKPNYADIACNFMDIFGNPDYTSLLSDPLGNEAEIETLLGAPIRVYAPGDHAPVLKNTLFLEFLVHKVALLKSGVFRLPHIPLVAGPHNVRDDRVVSHPACMKYATVVKSPAHYGASLHKTIYDGNLYHKANKQENFNTLRSRMFAVNDIIRNLGPGVYYSIGCRSPLGKGPTGAEHAELMKRSEEQQQGHPGNAKKSGPAASHIRSNADAPQMP